MTPETLSIPTWVATLCLVFIALTLSRSALYPFNTQHVPLQTSVALLRMSPVFGPFTKIGAFENARVQTRVYIEKTNGAYVAQDIHALAKRIGGPNAVRTAVIEATLGLPRSDAYGHKDAAVAAARTLLCVPDEMAVGLRIVSTDRLNRVTNAYALSCN